MVMNSYESIEANGFTGFVRIADLKISVASVPAKRGVYLVLRPASRRVAFVETGTGGFFKKEDPNVVLDILAGRWIEDAEVVYIGKAGSFTGKATLRSRLKQYMDFGMGRPVGHRGGRYIWQIKDIDDYIICWKELPDDEPRDVEMQMLSTFEQEFGRLPYANINR